MKDDEIICMNPDGIENEDCGGVATYDSLDVMKLCFPTSTNDNMKDAIKMIKA